MESAEAATAAPPEEDPFAGSGGDDPFAGGEPVATPPVVDKEGQIIGDPDSGLEPGQVPPPVPQEPQAAPAAPTPDPTPDPTEGANGAQEAAGEAEATKSPMRHYHILYQTGEKQWTEAEWDEDGRPTKVVNARNNEHALRLAFGILGSPENGVRVLPVPVSGFKPKLLKPKAVVPRTALDIS